MKPILISGIQPTGKLHIGNYLGALKNFVDFQNSGRYKCYFFIADLHSLTQDFKPKKRLKQIFDLALDYLVVGIEPKKSIIFIQSQVAAHTELGWILNTLAPFGELSRMTQFKEKSAGQKKNINAGLFNYPVLQAADILLYKAEFVPVGDDQLQHLEFTRTLARKFNNKFGKTFPELKPLLSETPRLMSLDDPYKKMSKSRPEGCLFLDDSPQIIREKIKKAVTDSGHEIKYDAKNKPAISNLMKIYSEMSGLSLKKIEKKYKGKGYGDFKKDLAEFLATHFSFFQEQKKRLSKQPQKVQKILETGAKKSRVIAQLTMAEIKKKIGINSESFMI